MKIVSREQREAFACAVKESDLVEMTCKSELFKGIMFICHKLDTSQRIKSPAQLKQAYNKKYYSSVHSVMVP